LAPVTVYIRLAKTTPVGNYTGNVVITSGGTTNQISTAGSNTVTKALLTVTADNKTKITGTPNPALTYIYSGFVNNEGPSVLTTQPAISTSANLSSPAGQYPITINGGVSANYNFNYIAGVLQVTSVVDIVVINTFTPNGDGVNDTWRIQNIEGFPNSVVEVFNRYGGEVFYSRSYPEPWDGKRKGNDVPGGTYYYIIDLKNGKRVTGWLAVTR
jgi:gliding motility-associated-like protein